MVLPSASLGILGRSPSVGVVRRVADSILAREAVAYWKASRYSGTGALLDLSGNGHNAQLGSTSGADSSDPLFLTGGPYLYLPGSAGNYAEVPEASNTLSGKSTGVVTLVARASHPTWRPSTQGALMGSVGGRLAFELLATGFIQLRFVDDSGTGQNITSGVVIPSVDHRVLVKCDLDIDAETVRFYTAPDVSDHTQAVWTELGVAQNAAAFTSLQVGAFTTFYAGSRQGTSVFWDSKLYGAWWYVDGAMLRGIDFTDLTKYNATRTSLTAVTGQTVTINRSASGRKSEVIDATRFLHAVDDYDVVADAAVLDADATTSLTAAVLFRKYGDTGAAQHIYGKKASAAIGAVGWHIAMTAAGNLITRLSDGTNNVSTGVVASADIEGLDVCAVQVIDRGTGTMTLYAFSPTGTLLGSSNASIAAVGNTSNALTLRAGASSDTPENFYAGSTRGRAVIRRVLNATEAAALAVELAQP